MKGFPLRTVSGFLLALLLQIDLGVAAAQLVAGLVVAGRRHFITRLRESADRVSTRQKIPA